MTTNISIPKGTIVGRIFSRSVIGDGLAPVTLLADVYVEATREVEGCWKYRVGRHEYLCAGSMAVEGGW